MLCSQRPASCAKQVLPSPSTPLRVIRRVPRINLRSISRNSSVRPKNPVACRLGKLFDKNLARRLPLFLGGSISKAESGVCWYNEGENQSCKWILTRSLKRGISRRSVSLPKAKRAMSNALPICCPCVKAL